MPPPTTNRPQAAPTPPQTGPAPATVGDEDPLSPRVMLQAFLRSKGIQPGSANYSASMRNLLTENARGSVDIPGLENMTPGTDPGVGQPGNVAGKIEQAPTRSNLPVPPAYVPPPDAVTANTVSQPDTGGTGLSLGNLGALIAAGGGAGLGYWLGGPRGSVDTSAPPVGGPAVAPQPAPAQTGDRFAVTPPDRPAIAGPQPNVALSAPGNAPQLPGAAPTPALPAPAPQAALPAPAPAAAAPPPQGPLSDAIDRAVAPAANAPIPMPAPPPTPALPAPTGPANTNRLVPGGQGLLYDPQAGIFVHPNPAVRALQPPVRVPAGRMRVPRLNIR